MALTIPTFLSRTSRLSTIGDPADANSRILKVVLQGVVPSVSVADPTAAPVDIQNLLQNPAAPADLIGLLKRIALQLDSDNTNTATRATSVITTAGPNLSILLPANQDRVGFSICMLDESEEGEDENVIRIGTSNQMTRTNLLASVEIKEGFYYAPEVNYRGVIYVISKYGQQVSFNLTTYLR